jgi:hypothetical protein
LAPVSDLGTLAQRIIDMTWTVVSDDPVIHVRASIPESNQEELRALIAALEKCLTKKETEDGQPT